MLGFSLTAQNKTIDSLKRVLAEESIHDTLKIDAYLGLAQSYLTRDLDTFYFYTEKSQKEANINHDYRLARIYNNKGLFWAYKSNPDSALLYLDKGLKELKKKDDTLVRATIYSNYALVYQNSNETDKTIEYNLKAIELLEENEYEVSRLHFNQAIIFGQANLTDLSRKHLKHAYLKSKASENYRIQGLALKGLAHYAIEDKKLDSAEIYLKEGLILCSKTASPQICYEINSKIGELYDNLERYEEAQKYLLSAKEYALVRKQPYNIMASNIFLGQHESKKTNYSKAVVYYKEFDELYKKNEILELGQLAYRSWSEAESRLGNFKESNALFEKYVVIKDSIFSQENRSILANAEARYETEKKDKEIAEQKLAIEENQLELQKRKTQYSIMTGITIFLLVSSLMGWFLYQQRQKRKNQEILTLKREQQVKTLESLMEGEEKERFRIAKELHDGVNGDLSAIKYKLTSMLEHNTAIVNEVVAMIDKSSEQVRAISHNLVPPSLEKFNLVEALEDYCITMNEIHEAHITYQHLGNPLAISKTNEINIYRIVQELVSNSIKHSGADTITIQTSNRENMIQLTVEDNGAGFNPEEVQKKGIGLRNIDSRIDYLNATKDFVSNSKGTSYTIEIDTSKLNDN